MRASSEAMMPMSKVVLVLAIMAGTPAPPVISATLLHLQLEEARFGDGLNLRIDFQGTLPSSTVVDSFVVRTMRLAAPLLPGRDILAMAYHDGVPLTGSQYSGGFLYSAENHKVLDCNELVSTNALRTRDNGYIVDTEENRSEIPPHRTWLLITLIFPNQPTRIEAYEALKSEALFAAAGEIDAYLYVCTGDAGSKSTWSQVKDSDGETIFAKYDAKSGMLSRKDTLIETYE